MCPLYFNPNADIFLAVSSTDVTHGHQGDKQSYSTGCIFYRTIVKKKVIGRLQPKKRLIIDIDGG